MCLKNDTHLAYCNINRHEPSLIIAGRNVVWESKQSNMLCFPPDPSSVSALQAYRVTAPRKPGNCVFSRKCCMLLARKRTGRIAIDLPSCVCKKGRISSYYITIPQWTVFVYSALICNIQLSSRIVKFSLFFKLLYLFVLLFLLPVWWIKMYIFKAQAITWSHLNHRSFVKRLTVCTKQDGSIACYRLLPLTHRLPSLMMSAIISNQA